MEGDKTADNDKELTSTSTSSLVMGKLLSTNKEEKSDSNDTLPTSSTDASTSIKLTHSVSDDPISSTSSDMDVSKPKPNDNLSTEVLDSVSANFDTEAELLEMSITTQPSEKIEENVDDLVNDLETLLGESTDAFTVSSKSTETKEVKNDVTSAFQEELANLLGDKPENEVSSNTGVTTDKIDVLEETTMDTVVLDKNELNIDKNICEKALESDANTKLEEKDITNANVSDGLELVSDAEREILVSENSSSEICISQMNRKEESENKESDETVEQVEDTVKENRKNTKQSESSVSSVEPVISQVMEEEIKNVEKELPSEESTDLAIEQCLDEIKQVPEKNAVIFENIEATQDVENETEKIQEDASIVEQTSSDENLKCLTKENTVEDRSIVACSKDKTTISDSESNVTKAGKVETILGTNGNQDVGKSEELQELIKEIAEENQGKFLPVANEDNVQDEKTVHDNKSVDKNVISVEVQDASAFDIENMEKESSLENIKACEHVKEDSNTTDQEWQEPQEISDESVDLSKVDQVNTKTMFETEGDDSILKSSEGQIKETEKTNKSIQDNVEGVCNPSESPDENIHISVQIVKNSSDDAQVLIEHSDSIKDKVIDSSELQSPEESKPEVDSEGDNLHLNETGGHIETDENQSCEELNCRAEDKSQQEESIAEIEHIDDQGVKDSKETRFKDVLPDSIILSEEKDQPDILENTFGDAEDSVKETSENAEEAKFSETTPVVEKDISKQVLGEIEITELSDDIANVTDEVDIIEVNPVIEEPEEAIQSVENLEQLQNDNIEEVNEERNVETNQYQPEDFEIINKDMIIEEIDNEVKCQLQQECVELNEQSLTEVKKVDPPDTSKHVDIPTEEVIKTDKQLDQQDSADHTVLHETSTNIKGIEKHNRESKQIKHDIITTEGVEVSETSTFIPIEDIQADKSLQKLEKNTEDVIVIKDNTKAENTLEVGKVEETVDTVTEVNKLEPSKEFENVEIINEIPASETSTMTEPKELIEVVKPVPEINIRRKTVEQDLEKVVCLSEESSDSDTSEPVSSLPKITEDKYDEESNLIKIAEEVDQFPDGELPCVETLPEIDNILSAQPPVIPSASSVDPSSNLETILAVASLQNESIPDVRVERRLSEKEIREMEAIRMAVASITDSSQDTYDSYLVDNSVALENSIQEISNSPEFASEVPAISNESNISTEGIVEDNSLLTNSCTEIQDQMLIDKCVIIPENDKTGGDVCKLISHEEVSNSSQNQADVVDDKCAKNFVSGELDEKLVPASDNVEKIESITSTEDSETVDNVESQKNVEIIEEKLVDGFKEKSQDPKIQLSLKNILENVDQNFESPERGGSLQKLEQRIVENDTKSITDHEIVLTNQISAKDVVSIQEVAKEKVPLLEVISKEDSTSISKNIPNENEESFSKGIDNDVTVHKEVIKDNKISGDTGGANEITLPEQLAEEKDVSSLDEIAEGKSEVEGRPLRSRTRRGNKISEPLSINVEDVDKKEKIYSPKITIKPVKVPDEEVSTTSDADGSKGSLKMTITKQSDKMHSILKVYNPEDDAEPPQGQEEPIPKLIIKPKMQQVEQQHSPKMTTRSSKAYSPTSTRCSSPRVTIKPVAKPTEIKSEVLSPLKITFKPMMKPEDATKKQSPKASKEQEQKNHNPKITIKPIPRPTETEKEETLTCTPKVIIKPIKKHIEENEIENEPERSSPKIIIKPVIKPVEQDLDQSLNQAGPKLKIKPIKKLDDEEIGGPDRDQGSPKVSIKPLVKPAELEEEEDIKKRIVLKINKGNLSTPGKDPKKREHPDDDKSEKIGIKLKFSTTGGHTHIIQEESNKRQRKDSGYSGSSGKKDIEEAPQKRTVEEKLPEKNKRLRTNLTPDKLNVDNYEDLKLVEAKIASPITLSEDSRSQHSADCAILDESNPSCADISKIADIASRTTYIEASPILTVGVATPTVNPAPKRRGRPRKVPLEIREELRDPPTIQSTPSGTPQTTPVMEGMSTPGSDVRTPEATPSPGGRPKRSCRGQNVMATLGIKPRKPRGRGRGSKVNMGDREPTVLQTPVHSVQTVPMKPEKETKLSKAKLKLMQKAAEEEAQKQKETQLKQKTEGVIPVVQEGIADKKEEVTTRRQKSQQQKEDDAVKAPTTGSPKVVGNTKNIISGPSASSIGGTGVQKKASNFPLEGVNIDSTPNTSVTPGVEIVTISTDDDSCGKETSDIASKVKTTLESKIKGKNSPPKRAAEKLDDNIIEEKKAKIEIQKSKAEEFQTKQADISDSLRVVGGQKEEEKDTSLEEDKKGEEKKVEEASADEAESGEDSEAERRREWILQKKQEAIKKCRAKRMEKLARAAELKKKRQEQAAQQREARKAAEEAEKAAAERGRATKRYGRYGVPKPQISLIDEPVQETAGTIKSHMGLFDPQTEPINITQPVIVDDENNFDKERAEPLKQLESDLPLEKSPQKISAPEPMVVDPTDDSNTKIRRSIGTEDVVMLDEETRMSADFRGSRAQTPAKQAIPPPDIMVEDSQGSMGTEGGKSRSSKTPKMEVFQDLESTIINADQLAEYSWNGQGPFMLQEQVAQFLGIKSFKRKYPQVTRRPVDMQERDYLKENGLATEAQCDLGLTAVNAQDILDIMYSDFQDKYEDYCRCQREKQARELANKQKALSQFSLKPGFDKLDILEQAVQSAAAWNQQFNKARREQRKAHMDLQSLTVHYPKSKMKVIPTAKIGHYPVALVPGQFTDYYKEFTPTELNNLPLNTMCYDEIKIQGMETESEDSSSESDSESGSSSGSSGSDSSCEEEDCRECVKTIKTEINGARETDSDDVVIIENDASSSDSVVLVSVTSAPVTA